MLNVNLWSNEAFNPAIQVLWCQDTLDPVMSLRIELGTAIRDAGQASLQRDISPLEGNRRRSKPATPISPLG